MLMCVCMCVREGERLRLPFVHFLCPGAGYQMPTPRTHSQSRAGACKCVYYLQSLDSKEQEMFFLLLSPSRTNTHTHIRTHRIHTQTTSITPFLSLLMATLILSGHQKRLKEFIRVYFIFVLNIFSGPLRYCFCVKAWESKHEKSWNPFFQHTAAV